MGNPGEQEETLSSFSWWKGQTGGPKILVKTINIFPAIVEFLTSYTADFPLSAGTVFRSRRSGILP